MISGGQNTPVYWALRMLISTKIDWIAQILAVGAAIWTTINWVLQKKMENRLNKQLEATKHGFQDQLQKLSIVYEHQKDSFKAVLSAMHEAIRAIEGNIRGIDDEWGSIGMSDYETFGRVVAEETLFLDSRTDQAIALFSQILWDAVDNPNFDQFTDSETVRRSYGHLKLISDRTAEYFRFKVGLLPENPDPLLDIELLGACRLINEQNFSDAGLPTKTIFKFGEYTSADEMVSLAHRNPDVLRSELQSLKRVLDEDESKRSFYHHLATTVEQYLACMQRLEPPK
jgi:hypothetical protein